MPPSLSLLPVAICHPRVYHDFFYYLFLSTCISRLSPSTFHARRLWWDNLCFVSYCFFVSHTQFYPIYHIIHTHTDTPRFDSYTYFSLQKVTCFCFFVCSFVILLRFCRLSAKLPPPFWPESCFFLIISILFVPLIIQIGDRQGELCATSIAVFVDHCNTSHNCFAHSNKFSLYDEERERKSLWKLSWHRDSSHDLIVVSLLFLSHSYLVPLWRFSSHAGLFSRAIPWLFTS